MPKTLNKTLPKNLTFYEFPVKEEDFKTAVIKGLTKPQKELSPRFFYDQRGSDLFEGITRLKEYYPTRVEKKIMDHHAKDILFVTREHTIIIEPGSGNNEKIAALLNILPQVKCCIPIEISGNHLLENSMILAKNFPKVNIVAVASDYMNPSIHLHNLVPGYHNPLIFFPGSSIGNYSPNQVIEVLKQFTHLMRGKGRLLIGVDLKKDPNILEKAYNDKEGITAAFNLNALYHIKRELALDELIPVYFEHHSEYNAELGRIEMHLVSKVEQQFEIDGTIIHFDQGETIHTENSYKYTLDEFVHLASKAGLNLNNYWMDDNELYSVQLFNHQPDS
ncbi:MAG: L-histidine N(alpha)-methyltransferase [Balneolales bacterium]